MSYAKDLYIIQRGRIFDMTTLVLCVDRDDDFGQKIGVSTPIVGRKNNLDAATAILLKDPEESDGNALFGAIKVYDELVNRGEKAEIATICGGPEVNETTDKKLFRELETVLYITKATEVVLVTDGSEDEYILPIIGSKVNIVSKRKIVVKQSDKLESLYFYFTKVLEDEKTQRIVVPISLFLIFAGVTSLLGIGNVGYGAVAVVIGLYLIIKTYHLEHPIRSFINDVRKGFDAKISFITSIISILLVLAGLATFIDGMSGKADKHQWNLLSTSFIVAFLEVVQNLVIWVIAATIIWIFGKAIDTYLTENAFPWQKTNYFFFLISAGFILNGSLDIIKNVVDGSNIQFLDSFFVILLGFAFFILGREIHDYFEKRFKTEVMAKGWRK